MVVIAAKDEQAMKALAPKYWEQRGGIRPSSVWVSGADRHYMAIRADLHGDDTNFVNPYTSSYFSYASLIIAASFNRPLPPWFLNGLAGVLSNTIVRSNYILLGPPIPWHLDALRQDQRFFLKQLVSITDESPEYVRESGRERFDAQAWAFVHLLMFGEQGKYQTAINRFSSLLSSRRRQGCRRGIRGSDRPGQHAGKFVCFVHQQQPLQLPTRHGGRGGEARALRDTSAAAG
jgi:hypothetical protein